MITITWDHVIDYDSSLVSTVKICLRNCIYIDKSLYIGMKHRKVSAST